MLLFKDFILRKYKKPLYRVPISLAIPCPHRVGNKGQGCLFCPEDGAQARHIRHSMDIPEQVEKGIAYIRRRYGKDCGLIAYLQSFTNTNDSAENLEKTYSRILNLADFEMLIVSTRPDCLPENVMDYLQKINSTLDLWIELGVQTANDKTLGQMNRQHSFKEVENSVRKLHARDIKSAAHVILGLPGEDTADFRDTAAKISNLPFSAVKIHNLLILKNTPLASIYHRQKNNMPTNIPKIRPLNEYEYAEALADFIRHIPVEWPLMRVMADATDEDIIAPKWWMRKGQFLEFLKTKLDSSDTNSLLPEVVTADGSKTLYHPVYRQHFHSLAGAVSEAKNKFIAPCQIRKMLRKMKNVRILDIGFGLGVNALEASKLANHVRSGKLNITSLEKDIKTINIAAQKSPKDHALANLAKNLHHKDNFSEIKVIPGDARRTLKNIKTKFHAVFLDPFSHETNPELWTYDFIRMISKKITRKAILATYSAAFPVRGAMIRAGLIIGDSPSFGRKSPGTLAAISSKSIKSPVNEKTMDIILKSTAGLPYRDPGLKNTTDKICEIRRKSVAELRSRGIPKWFRQ